MNTYHIVQNSSGEVMVGDPFQGGYRMAKPEFLPPRMWFDPAAAMKAIGSYMIKMPDVTMFNMDDRIKELGLEVLDVRIVIGGLAGGNVL